MCVWAERERERERERDERERERERFYFSGALRPHKPSGLSLGMGSPGQPSPLSYSSSQREKEYIINIQSNTFKWIFSSSGYPFIYLLVDDG